MAKSNIQITGATLYLLIKIKCAGLQIIFSRREETCLFGTDPRNKTSSYTVYIYIYIPTKIASIYTRHILNAISVKILTIRYIFLHILSPHLSYSHRLPLYTRLQISRIAFPLRQIFLPFFCLQPHAHPAPCL